ncbi:MAG TPA: 2-dehydropantoate 2-reductase N-terminal domain-containing protein [Kofleriaceae bacterium]|nr:2-dehydropantoate 2-reductase N-terminal domain-containing protein [Kofleriaceae bacterium]
MRLVILGAGAIGGAVGALLGRARHEVVLLARGAHLAAIRERGLRVETPDGAFVAALPASAPAEHAWRDDDVVLVATKTQDVEAALVELAAPVHVPIACLTNGVAAERIALRRARTVYGACVILPASHLAPGVVQLWAAPVPGSIDVGRYPDGADDRAFELSGALASAGLLGEARRDIMRWKRGKLLSNLANGVEALCGRAARAGELVTAMRDEARACFAAANLSVTTPEEDASRRVGYTLRPIAGAERAGGSTWQSLARGARSVETDYLNGEIALLGRLHGVPTPINEAVQRIVADAARAGVAPGSMPLAELEARARG